jgi:hypothetical protein
MTMVFCRGCGKEIHESAPTCPHCGYVVIASASADLGKSLWMAGVSLAISLISFLNWFGISTWDRNTIVGLWMFVFTATLLAGISLAQKRGGKVLSWVSIVISGLTFLILIGK